ncbi:MAG: amidohydrolase family protein [Bacteroidales bacterium]
MRRFSAQYIITGTGDILKRGIITTDDDGRIREVTDTGGHLTEKAKTEYYNGIITPGFVNCHCHLELSALHKHTAAGTGLGAFIRSVRESRPPAGEASLKSMEEADSMMYRTGTSACGDICNSSISFPVKEKSKIKYINFLEVFGVDPSRAATRIKEVEELKKEADSYSSPSYITPHSFYSMSATLMKKVKELSSSNRVSSIHHMESDAEEELLRDATGMLMESYRAMGIDRDMMADRVRDHVSGLLNFVTSSGNLILVHNTYASPHNIRAAARRDNCFLCLCPRSNMHIEDRLPPVDMMAASGLPMVIGTDSLASNSSLDMLEEMKMLSRHFPAISLEEMTAWATINGARALGIDNKYGSIEPGKTPGLTLIEKAALADIKLTKESRARRLL